MKSLIIILCICLLFSCQNNESKKDVIKITKSDVKEKLIQKENTAETKKNIELYGKITTIADGFDVKKVTLWSSVTSSRKAKAVMLNGEKVKILKDADPYYLVESQSDSKRKGYCMKGFVKITK